MKRSVKGRVQTRTPIFFILSPGVNPLKDVEALGKKSGYTQMDKNFHNVSLGQGQEVVAEAAMNTAAGIYADFWSHPMIVYRGQVVNGSGMIVSMPMLLKSSQVFMLL